ncbi:Uma2 family endonuclease [Candidatus Poriferisodalis sp.]|uniref:Uma2 family endonuclease n=1 Tax=Candidatus Poriferisodalis sp. TaxID=3101277 RepID=UPI003B02BD04
MTTAIQSSPTTLLTAADLLLLGDEKRGELIRGVFCEMAPPGREHGRIAALVTHELVAYALAERAGTVVGESGVQLERDPDTVRAPDVAFTSYARSPAGSVTHRYAQEVPELVVEVVSPSDRHAAVHDKARMWLGFGAQLVWVVFPASRTVEVHRVGTDPIETLNETDVLDGADVLPGFSCPLSRLFAD